MTKWQLFQALAAKGPFNRIVLPDGREALLHAVLREDGSGSCFILSATPDGQETVEVFVRTTD